MRAERPLGCDTVLNERAMEPGPKAMVAKRKTDEAAEWQPQRRLFTVDEYERMIEAGVLGRERVELIEGAILCMAAIDYRIGGRSTFSMTS